MNIAYQQIDLLILGLTFVMLLVASWTDLKDMKIKNTHLLMFFIIRLTLIPLVPMGADHLIGLLLGFSVFFIPAMVLNVQMGGDIKIYALIGLFLGWKILIPHFIMTLIISLIIFLIKKLKKEKLLKNNLISMAGVFLLALNMIVILSLLGVPCPCGILINMYF